jgi:16S rRNA processing protein RimM
VARPDRAEEPRDPVVLGRVSGAHGVRGWVKVYSYTDPRENVLDYPDWWLFQGRRKRRFRVIEGRPHGKTVIAALESVDDRDAASEWIGAEIVVERDSLPDPGEGQFYWAELIGLDVRDGRGEHLGRIRQLLETGAHDVMVIERGAGEDLLIPFVFGRTVKAVLPENGCVVVDWEWV